MRLLYTLLIFVCTASCVSAQWLSGPVARCKAMPYVNVQGDGCSAPVRVSDIDGGSYHPNGLFFTSTIDVAQVTVGMPQRVRLTVFDGRRFSSCTTTVSAYEDINPSMVCVDELTVTTTYPSAPLPLTPLDVDEGSSDNCAFELELDVDFGFFYGQRIFSLRGTDDSGNFGIARGYVNVLAPNMPSDFESPCLPYGYDTYEYIHRVRLMSTTQPVYDRVGPAGGGVFYGTNLPIYEGDPYYYELTPAYPTGTAYPEYWAVYVDMNLDGDLDDPEDLITQQQGTGTVSGSFALLNPTHYGERQVRVLMSYDPITGPCQTNYWGSRFDFVINLQPNPSAPSATAPLAVSAAVEADRTIHYADEVLPTPVSAARQQQELARRSGRSTQAQATVFPNPATAGGTVTVTTEAATIELYALTGRLVSSWATRAGAVPTPIGLGADLPAGVYLLRAGDRTERLVVR